MSQSREDLRCEVDLFDKLDRLRASYGLETPIYDQISQAALIGMEKWFEEQMIGELKMSPRTTEELLERFKCGSEILLPSLVNLEKMGRIKKVNGKYIFNN
jgi:predicted Rossmann fold nucleotide-binding protein DprA/Smf involved in DNA uptake